MDTNKLKELAERAADDFGSFDPSEAEQDFMEKITPRDVLGLIAEVERLRNRLEIDERTPYDGIACRDETIKGLDEKFDRLKAENEALRSALQAVHAEVDGNIRPLTRDLVNMVSGVKNGSHPNDIYDHCDEIDRIIDAALEGGGR